MDFDKVVRDCPGKNYRYYTPITTKNTWKMALKLLKWKNHYTLNKKGKVFILKIIWNDFFVLIFIEINIFH